MDNFGTTCRIRLADGPVVLIDQIDFCRAVSYTWRAVRMGGRECVVALESLVPTTTPPITLARFIARATDGDRVIMLNGNIYDCRRANLAIISTRELAHLEDTLQRTAL